MKKIRAFTIMEITIVMLLMGLVISMGYSVFRIFDRQFKGFQEKSRFSNEIYQLRKVIQRDLDSAKLVVINKDSVLLIFKERNGSANRYHFFDSLLVRSGVRPDTFKLIPSGYIFNPLDTVNPLARIQILASFSFAVTSKKEQVYQLSFQKKYTPEYFMNGPADSVYLNH